MKQLRNARSRRTIVGSKSEKLDVIGIEGPKRGAGSVSEIRKVIWTNR